LEEVHDLVYQIIETKKESLFLKELELYNSEAKIPLSPHHNINIIGY